jgi:hypothetical protein
VTGIVLAAIIMAVGPVPNLGPLGVGNTKLPQRWGMLIKAYQITALKELDEAR